MRIENLINKTTKDIEDLLIEGEAINVGEVLEHSIKDLKGYVGSLSLNPELYFQREQMLSGIANDCYAKLAPKVKDDLWLRINLIGFVYEYFYKSI